MIVFPANALCIKLYLGMEQDQFTVEIRHFVWNDKATLPTETICHRVLSMCISLFICVTRINYKQFYSITFHQQPEYAQTYNTSQCVYKHINNRRLAV